MDAASYLTFGCSVKQILTGMKVQANEQCYLAAYLLCLAELSAAIDRDLDFGNNGVLSVDVVVWATH